jgi:hypothetical protein
MLVMIAHRCWSWSLTFGVVLLRDVNRRCENSVKLDVKTRLELHKNLINRDCTMVTRD